MINIQSIKTETRNAKTTYIDELPITDIMTLINEEDAVVPLALSRALPALSKIAEHISSAFTEGGRLIYIGAGTSGRIGVLDASECPPTYGTDPSQVVGIIAGGNNALTDALEGAEDDEQAGREDIQHISITSKDIIVALAASGRTPYTLAAMKAAKEIGALTAAIVCSPHSPMARKPISRSSC
ncbi:N-acetylmuramic acid 6-phosphate etherase [Sinobaca sp. H24]|uniref:N-acetylmuramic acid 6-phosphate etherase n=1 Tax=Sinobaca sp. H24 TaxID=2923376 RepID=UPI00207A2C57|nr:N-acetylmuramic acid 6-phosphate etherase [Sinobaca sp. H24]